MGTVNEWAEKVQKTFPVGVKVIPPGAEPNVKASAGDVYEDSDGRILFRIWPDPYKDLNIDLATVTEEPGGWRAHAIGTEVLLQPWAPEEGAEDLS